MYDHNEFADEYNMFMRELRKLKIPHSTGGITGFPGMFIYTVARKLKARKIVEVGTRNGISAATFAHAMNKTAGKGVLISIDVVDVERGKARPGVDGQKFELVPSQLIRAVGDSAIDSHFVVGKGEDVLKQVPAKSVDIVLLDGSHKEDDVYRELPLAKAALRSGGVILLDDVYPHGAGLRCHKKVIPGPWLALQRAVEDGIIDGYVRPNPDFSIAYIQV